MAENELRHAIAIFVKTPGFSPIKTRLANRIGKDLAEEFYNLSIQAIQEVVTSALERSPSLSAFWAIAESDSSAVEHWKDFGVIHQRGDSLGERMHGVFDDLKVKFDSVTFIGGDAPQITTELILSAIAYESIDRDQINVGPASDGGFYLFSSNSKISEEVWRTPIYSCEDTLSRLLKCFKDDYKILQLPVLTDVDEAKDLPQLLREFENSKLHTHGQQRIVDWLKNRNEKIINE